MAKGDSERMKNIGPVRPATLADTPARYKDNPSTITPKLPPAPRSFVPSFGGIDGKMRPDGKQSRGPRGKC